MHNHLIRLCTVVLFLLAILVGLLLPELAIRTQDGQRATLEAANIEPVQISEDSGLNNAEKIAILADPDRQITAISTGKHQDASSLSESGWQFWEALSYNNIQLLDPATGEQKTHGARLVTLDTNAFIIWEVLFADDLGTQIRFYIDDESNRILSISYTANEKLAAESVPDAIGVVLDTYTSFNGLYWEEAVEETDQELYENDASTDVEPFETLFCRILLYDGTYDEVVADIPLEMDTAGFRLNFIH